MTLLSVSLSYLFYKLIGTSSILLSACVFVAVFVSVILSSYIFMEKSMREKAMIMVKSAIQKRF